MIFYFSLQDFSSNSFQKYQDVPTSGATDVEQFTINGNQFLAFANCRNDSDGFNTESFIYKMNNLTEKFSLYQTINTMGAVDMEYFTIADKYYLAVANFESARSTRRLKLVIYQWNGQEFVVFQNVSTRGAMKLKFYKTGNEFFLAIANLDNVDQRSLDLVIYKWRNNSFDKFSKLSLTLGNFGGVASFAIKNETFIAFANDHLLEVRKWSGRVFSRLQTIPTYGTRDVKSFKVNGQIFLGITNFYDGSKANIYKWNGDEFVSFKSLFTIGAIAWHPFVILCVVKLSWV